LWPGTKQKKGGKNRGRLKEPEPKRPTAFSKLGGAGAVRVKCGHEFLSPLKKIQKPCPAKTLTDSIWGGEKIAQEEMA